MGVLRGALTGMCVSMAAAAGYMGSAGCTNVTIVENSGTDGGHVGLPVAPTVDEAGDAGDGADDSTPAADADPADTTTAGDAGTSGDAAGGGNVDAPTHPTDAADAGHDAYEASVQDSWTPEVGSQDSWTADVADAGTADVVEAGPIPDGGLGGACGEYVLDSGTYQPTDCLTGLSCYMAKCGPLGAMGGACLPSGLSYAFTSSSCNGVGPPCVISCVASDSGGGPTCEGPWCLPVVHNVAP